MGHYEGLTNELVAKVALLIVKHYIEQGTVYLQLSVVVDETELPELIHEKVDAAARGPHQVGQSFLRHFDDHLFRLPILAVAGQH